MSPALATDQPLIVRLLNEQELLEDVTQDQMTRARQQFTGSPEESLVLAELISEQAVARVHGDHLGIGWLDIRLGGDDEDPVVLDYAQGTEEPRELGTLSEVSSSCRELASRITDAACRRCMIVPVGVENGRVDLACLNPNDFSMVDEVSMRTGYIVRPRAATLTLVTQLIGDIFGERDMVREIAGEGGSAEIKDEDSEEDDLEVVVDLLRPIPNTKDSQVVRIANILLSGAIEEHASDIHLEPYEDAVRVRYRIDGKLIETTPPPKALFIPTISRLKILAKMDIAEKRVPQDGAIALKQGDKRVDLRVSTVPTIYGEKMCIRLLEKEGIPERLTDLGFSEQQSEHFLEAARSPHGLMFVTGPTGSGKSTTLYCCLNLINEPEDNIVTVEDPVEYKFYGLNQVHVKANQGLTFASALRSFLRQDPDKIMVGEVRDQETAEICMRAALTGHLVLSTLHTNSALQVVSRLVDMGIEPFLLGPALRLLEAQRLARRLCADCKEPYELPENVALRHGLEPGITLYRAVQGSCPTCRGAGNKGRVGLYEVIPITDELKDVISSGAEQNDIQDVAKKAGMKLLEDDARSKLIEGITSLEEVAEYIKLNE